MSWKFVFSHLGVTVLTGWLQHSAHHQRLSWPFWSHFWSWTTFLCPYLAPSHLRLKSPGGGHVWEGRPGTNRNHEPDTAEQGEHEETALKLPGKWRETFTPPPVPRTPMEIIQVTSLVRAPVFPATLLVNLCWIPVQSLGCRQSPPLIYSSGFIYMRKACI